MAKEDEKIIKYTIVPKNSSEDYDSNFRLSLTEFAKAVNGKTLVAPLILYNSELDIPIDMDTSLEEYIIYVNADDLVTTIKQYELTEGFRTLIIHGFDIDLDDIRNFYCPLARKNAADVCINVIQEIDIDNNLTFYLYNDLDKFTEEEWLNTKDQLKEDMREYIAEYKMYEDDFQIFEEMDQDELLEFLPYFINDVNEDDIEEFYTLLDKKKQEVRKRNKEETDSKVLSVIPTNENCSESKQIKAPKEDDVIYCSYESSDGFIAIKKFQDFYSIEDDNYEVLLTLDQIDFLIQQYNRIKDK